MTLNNVRLNFSRVAVICGMAPLTKAMTFRGHIFYKKLLIVIFVN